MLDGNFLKDLRYQVRKDPRLNSPNSALPIIISHETG